MRAGQQRVDQRGFAHAGLADQHAGVAGQERPQRRYILLCAEFQHAIADGGIGGEPFARGCGRFGQVAFVQHDQHVELLVESRDQAACQQFVAERRFGGDHHDDLRDVRGDEFFAERIGAMQQRAARRDAFDHSLRAGAVSGRRVCGALNFHQIAARRFAFFAARQAGDLAAVIEPYQILPAECGHDLSRFHFIGDTALAASFASRRATCTAIDAHSLPPCLTIELKLGVSIKS